MDSAQRSLLALDPGTLLVDGLALGAMGSRAADLAERHRLVALVHHPLADETRLSVSDRDRFLETERTALAHCRRVIVTSRTTGRRLVEGFGVEAARLLVAPPGTERHERAARVGDPPVVLTVATLVPRKGHDVLLDALAECRDLAWTARFVGEERDPAWAEGLRSRAHALDLSERVRFLGAVDDVEAEFRGADLFVLPSRHEGYGMVYAEALAYGLPTLGCTAGAVPEVLPPDCGGLVPPDDAPALARALRNLLADRGTRDAASDAAWRAAEALPRWDDTIASIVVLLRRMSG